LIRGTVKTIRFATFVSERLILGGVKYMRINWKNANKQEQLLLESITILTGGRNDLLEFLFDISTPRLRKRAGILRDDSWQFGPEEILLIQAALDFWSGSGHLAFWECLEIWNDNHWNDFVGAIQKLKGNDPQGPKADET